MGTHDHFLRMSGEGFTMIVCMIVLECTCIPTPATNQNYMNQAGTLESYSPSNVRNIVNRGCEARVPL
jgi:hypothetical protein